MVNFRNTILTLGEKIFQPDSSATAEKGVLKEYNRSSLCIDREALAASYPQEYTNSPEEQEKFFTNYGFTKAMITHFISHCSTIRHVQTLIDDGILMEKRDGRVIEAETKEGMPIPRDMVFQGLLQRTDADLFIVTCPRLIEVQDLCFFLIHLAATAPLPTTFQLMSEPSKICQIGATKTVVKINDAGDYLPLGEHVESALDMIEGLQLSREPPSLFELMETMLQNLKDEEGASKESSEEVGGEEEEEKKQNVILIITSSYPWGSSKQDSRQSAEQKAKEFLELLNQFSELSVTFIFLVESRNERLVKYYENFLNPETEVKTDVKVAKGFGQMIEGVKNHNPWLNYCIPVHLAQSVGLCTNVISKASREPLSLEDVATLCTGLVGDVAGGEEDEPELKTETEEETKAAEGEESEVTEEAKAVEGESEMNQEAGAGSSAEVDGDAGEKSSEGEAGEKSSEEGGAAGEKSSEGEGGVGEGETSVEAGEAGEERKSGEEEGAGAKSSESEEKQDSVEEIKSGSERDESKPEAVEEIKPEEKDESGGKTADGEQKEEGGDVTERKSTGDRGSTRKSRLTIEPDFERKSVTDKKAIVKDFIDEVRTLMESESYCWNPANGKREPMIDVERLEKHITKVMGLEEKEVAKPSSAPTDSDIREAVEVVPPRKKDCCVVM